MDAAEGLADVEAEVEALLAAFALYASMDFFASILAQISSGGIDDMLTVVGLGEAFQFCEKNVDSNSPKSYCAWNGE